MCVQNNNEISNVQGKRNIISFWSPLKRLRLTNHVFKLAGWFNYEGDGKELYANKVQTRNTICLIKRQYVYWLLLLSTKECIPAIIIVSTVSRQNKNIILFFILYYSFNAVKSCFISFVLASYTDVDLCTSYKIFFSSG